MLLAVSKDGPDGLLECAGAPDTFPVLGDASRGALYLALRPAASNGESPSPPPPERRALSDLSGLFDPQLVAELDLHRKRFLLDPVFVTQEIGVALRQG
jgi:hypothetical protein